MDRQRYFMIFFNEKKLANKIFSDDKQALIEQAVEILKNDRFLLQKGTMDIQDSKNRDKYVAHVIGEYEVVGVVDTGWILEDGCGDESFIDDLELLQKDIKRYIDFNRNEKRGWIAAPRIKKQCQVEYAFKGAKLAEFEEIPAAIKTKKETRVERILV